MAVPPASSFSISQLGPGAFAVRGELDMATAPRFIEQLRQSFPGDAPPKIRLDLSGLTFTDSAGVRAIIGVASISGCVTLALESPSGAVRRTLELAGIDQHARIQIVP